MLQIQRVVSVKLTALFCVSDFAKSIQPTYNQNAKYLIKPQKLHTHKAGIIKDLKNSQKMVNVLNIRLLL